MNISNANPTAVDFTGGSFKGTYTYNPFDTENKSILLLGEENTLYYPLSGAHIGAFRAYFQLDTPAAVKSFKLNFEGKRPTGLTPNPSPVREGSAGAWYDMQGRKLQAKPIHRGIYVNNGRKVVIK